MKFANPFGGRSAEKCALCKDRDAYFKCSRCGNVFCKECCENAVRTIQQLAVGRIALSGETPIAEDMVMLKGLGDEESSICPRCASLGFDQMDPMGAARKAAKTCARV
jgi:uncharacterized C2H2 Zn-finger protein